MSARSARRASRPAGRAELAFPFYRLRQFGNSAIFYQYELLGPIDESRLRKGVAKPPAKGNMKELELRYQCHHHPRPCCPPSARSKPSKEDGPFTDMRVCKGFADAGTFDEIVIGHVPPMDAELSDERWIMFSTRTGSKRP